MSVASPPESAEWSVRPIGYVTSPYTARADAPHQATVLAKTRTTPAEGQIVLDETIPLSALRGLEGFERLWVLAWLHRSQGWRAAVHAPRGPRVRRGVLATRAPHRPNALGLSCVRLLRVEGRTLHIAELDLLDGTPVLDVKPYIPYADAFPNARAGWVDEVDAFERARTAARTDDGDHAGPARPRGARAVSGSLDVGPSDAVAGSSPRGAKCSGIGGPGDAETSARRRRGPR